MGFGRHFLYAFDVVFFGDITGMLIISGRVSSLLVETRPGYARGGHGKRFPDAVCSSMCSIFNVYFVLGPDTTIQSCNYYGTFFPIFVGLSARVCTQ